MPVISLFPLFENLTFCQGFFLFLFFCERFSVAPVSGMARYRDPVFRPSVRPLNFASSTLPAQLWTLPAQLGQLKTDQDGKGLLQIHLWCPDDLPRLWDGIE